MIKPILIHFYNKWECGGIADTMPPHFILWRFTMYQYKLKLYKNSSENNDVQKVLSNETVIQGYSRTAVDILSPVIELAGVEVNTFNYCYVEELKRYYYIENMTLSPNGVTRLIMRVDVLMSYREDILESHGIITKSRNYNPYTGDHDVESRYNLEKHEFENGFDFNNGDFVIVAMRG